MEAVADTKDTTTGPAALAPISWKYEFVKTTHRALTRRNFFWLGQTCNIRCTFCYFLDRINSKEHPEHAFMSFEKARDMCATMRFHYGCESIDIQGGEPTIFKPINDLVRYCASIGLRPTLITNGMVLAHKHRVEELRDSGLYDVILSVNGLREVYDAIAGVPGGHKKQTSALQNLAEAGVPIRFNCVLSKTALPQLMEIAELAVAHRVRVVNFIAFNPFEDQAKQGKRTAENVPSYSEVAGYLNGAIAHLEAHDIEANVRYMPICFVRPELRKNMFNFQQLSYDLHEGHYASWCWSFGINQRISTQPLDEPYDLRTQTFSPGIGHVPATHVLAPGWEEKPFENTPELVRAHGRLRASEHVRYAYSAKCARCAAKAICDGFHSDYSDIFGTDEARPITDHAPTSDPTYYVRHQRKVVECQDYDWALESKD
ncbi:radical SAM protein [Oleispirillum naphthae]|uniref:radical SAM protein n=1 Tax=Oleispirillum naphthae TaxID=2838853 RepID=UPI003082238D